MGDGRQRGADAEGMGPGKQFEVEVVFGFVGRQFKDGFLVQRIAEFGWLTRLVHIVRAGVSTLTSLGVVVSRMWTGDGGDDL